MACPGNADPEPAFCTANCAINDDGGPRAAHKQAAAAPDARINGMCRPGEMLPGYVLNTAVTPGPDLSRRNRPSARRSRRAERPAAESPWLAVPAAAA